MNLIRNLLGLVIIMSILPLMVLSFRFVADIDFGYDEIYDELSLCQLRETLLLAYDLNVSAYELDFIYKNREFNLSLVNGKLMLQPGSEFFLNELEDMHFEEKRGCVYVCYQKDNRSYERVIASAKGLHIDDFSACAELADEPDFGEEQLYHQSQ